MRGGRKHFTHSKMMAWVAFDRAIKLVEECGCAADEHFDRWQKIRDQIHEEVCERGYNVTEESIYPVLRVGCDRRESAYDAADWIFPITDERVRGTIEGIERELMQDGLVLRYRPRGRKR